ncbi:hypothetical protein XI02_44725 [Bradyrhizobium sp. CCBAU 21365]|nr:hypothetical protein XI02_44725 [Bradyrhizobium sp. CCBAU 21365]
MNKTRSIVDRQDSALPLPLAGEGRGGGSLHESCCGESPHPARRADLPRKRERWFPTLEQDRPE